MPAERLHDVIIAGLGAMGSATALELSRRGVDVLGFDRYTPPHAFGSSHGESRIIREAYFEHPVYVPMVRRAYELWRALEQSAGVTLLRETGGLMIGRHDSALVQGARLSAQTHRLPHEALGATEITARFPALRPERDMVAVWEPRAGILFPEACISAQRALARQRGAELHDGEVVEHWEPEGDNVRVNTSQGEYRARRLIVTAGAWVASVLPGLPLPLRIERQVLHWFECADASDSFDAEHCPIHLWQFDGRRFFYGFPALDGAVKAGFHHEGETTTADGVRREVAAVEIDAVRAVMRRFIPGADGPLRKSVVCLYTNTPDGHFWIDRHPAHPHVLIASPCSGHGFKFAPVIGEILADLVQGRAPRFELQLFRRR
jgi:sarcosine oxidase